MRSSFANLLQFLLFLIPLINTHELHPSHQSCRPIQKRQLVSSGEGGATNGPSSSPQLSFFSLPLSLPYQSIDSYSGSLQVRWIHL